MGRGSPIYLDNAATSWPKPPEVREAVQHYLAVQGAPAGRGVYRRAAEVDRLVADTRRKFAAQLGPASPQEIVFCANGTDALNLAIHGWLATEPGGHVVTTAAEHNSVLRPLAVARRRYGCTLDVVACDGSGRVDPEAVGRAVRSDTRLVAVTAASNVTGAINDVAAIAREVRRRHAEAVILVDAAQRLGHGPFEVPEEVDLVATSAHKGLLGILGLGVLWIRAPRDRQMFPLRQGGTGVNSASEDPPEAGPARFEAGNLNVPGIVALRAALAYIERRTLAAIEAHERALAARLREGLAAIPGVKLYPQTLTGPHVGVVSFSIEGWDVQEAATLLDGQFGIECRAGLHCAPRIHEAIGSATTGGTIRLSVGAFNEAEEIDQAVAAVEQLSAAAS